MKDLAINSRKRRFQLAAAFSTAAVLIIAVFTVLLCYKLNWGFDMTTERLFTLSKSSLSTLGALSEDVRIAGIYPSGKEEQMVVSLLEQYQKNGSRIFVEYIDAEQEPAKLAAYHLTEAAVLNGSIIVKSGARYKILRNEDLFEYTKEGSTFNGEREITGAIRYVTSDKLPVVYFTEGNGETSASTSLTRAVAALEQDAYAVKTLRLTEGDKIPEDAALLILVSPKQDITEEALAKLQAYIKRGGRIFLLIDAVLNSNETVYTNLSALTAAFGIGITNNYVVEEDARYYLSKYNLYLIPLMGKHEITNPIAQAGTLVILPIARGLGLVEYDKSEITNTVLLQSSEKSWIRADMTIADVNFTQNDYVGPAPLAYASVKSNVKWGAEAARMVVVGNSSFALDGSIEVQANRSFFLNCALWLAGDAGSEQIAVKTINSGAMIIRGSAFLGLAVLCLIVLPGFAFVTAFVVWARRRNR